MTKKSDWWVATLFGTAERKKGDARGETSGKGQKAQKNHKAGKKNMREGFTLRSGDKTGRDGWKIHEGH